MCHLGMLVLIILLTACGGSDTPQQVFRATVPPDGLEAPVYTETPTRTPSLTPTPTATFTVTPSPTLTRTPTPSPTRTPSPTPTTPLLTLTRVSHEGAPPTYIHPTAELTTPEGWSCGDFPCEDDIDGFMQRIRVPEGYMLEHVGRFPGQPIQITYGIDSRLYATLITDPAQRTGAVYVMDDTGGAEQYSPEFISPAGLAFQPGTDTLYVSARITPQAGGGLWRVLPDGTTEIVLDNLPCCLSLIDNQPNGMVFGPDGYLYLGVGSLTDHAESPDPAHQPFAVMQPLEAAVLRIQPHTGEVEPFAQGIRNPVDLTFDSTGQFYVTDNGLLDGLGDRLLAVVRGGHYGFPYWRNRGCSACPPTDFSITYGEDLLRFPDYTLPRGIVAYTGTQYPSNLFDSLFVALWNGTPNAQRIVRIDPRAVPTDPEQLATFVPEPFVTGLIRPTDVVVAPDGSLVIADFIYGHIWRVRYIEDGAAPRPASPTAASMPPSIFVTATPRR